MSSLEFVSLDEEFKRNPELRKEDLNMLREWCEKQPHLPNITDNELVIFLHSNYYRLEATKATIENYYTLRTHLPEFFANRDPVASEDIKKMFNIVSTVILDKPTKDGYKIIFGRLLDYDPSHYIYNDAMKCLNMVIDLWVFSEGTTPGHIILFDMKNVVLGHAGRLSPLGLKKFLSYLQDGLPVRLKGLHFMNTTAVMDVIFNMMKPFMKKELLDMVHMHSSMDSLEKFIPLEVLPNESGGIAGPLADLNNKSIKQINQHRDWFLEEEKTKRVNESLRPGKGKTVTDLFGVEGSFKKLEID